MGFLTYLGHSDSIGLSHPGSQSSVSIIVFEPVELRRTNPFSYRDSEEKTVLKLKRCWIETLERSS